MGKERGRDMGASRYAYIKKRRHAVMKVIVEAMGGKCCICGYDKASQALDFHHVDPKEKDMVIANALLFKWSRIVAELRKCILVCANCHMEIHQGVTKIPEDVVRFSEDYADYRTPKKPEPTYCERCGGEKARCNRRFCSEKCERKSKQKVDWDSIDLVALSKKHTMVALGKMFGVSDNGVRKHVKRQLAAAGKTNENLS